MRMGLLLLCAALTASCGRYSRDDEMSGTTQVNFRSAPSEGQALNLLADYTFIDRILNAALVNQGEGDLIDTFSSVAGGLMVYAANAGNPALGGSKYLSGAGAGGSVNWNIPNGDYRFYLVGYDAAGMSSAGTPACGVANGGSGVRLGGGTFTVIMSAGACNAPPFVSAGPPLGANISTLTVYGCNASEDLSANTFGTGCAGSDAAVLTAQVKLVEWDHFDAPRPPPFVGPGLSSTCATEASPIGSYYPVQGTADGAMPLGTIIFLGGSGTCLPGELIRAYYLEGGLAAPYNTGAFPAATQVISSGGPRADLGRWMVSASSAELYLKAP